MKKFYALITLALAGITTASAQWNTNATPKLLFGLEYTDPETGEVKTGGDYYACADIRIFTVIPGGLRGRPVARLSGTVPFTLANVPTCSCSTAMVCLSSRSLSSSTTMSLRHGGRSMRSA